MGGLSNEVVFAHFQESDNKKVMINLLGDEIMNMLLEVKRRNRMNEMNNRKAKNRGSE